MSTYDQHVIDQACYLLAKRWGFDFIYVRRLFGGDYVT
jgi:hypothetical protein